MIEKPPVFYDHLYRGTLFIHEFKAADVDGKCREMGSTEYFEIKACALSLSSKVCMIIMPKENLSRGGQLIYDALWRHEIAHCNGWPGHHPK